eukprot:6339923-Amphidinium_carterae.1
MESFLFGLYTFGHFFERRSLRSACPLGAPGICNSSRNSDVGVPFGFSASLALGSSRMDTLNRQPFACAFRCNVVALLG